MNIPHEVTHESKGLVPSMNNLILDLNNMTHSMKSDVKINPQNLEYEVKRFHNTFVLRDPTPPYAIKPLRTSKKMDEVQLSTFVSDYMYHIIAVLNNTYVKPDGISLILTTSQRIDEDRFVTTIKDRLVTYLWTLQN